MAYKLPQKCYRNSAAGKGSEKRPVDEKKFNKNLEAVIEDRPRGVFAKNQGKFHKVY